LLLTEGLARARQELRGITDATGFPPGLERRTEELLALIDEALLALDLDANDPLLEASS